MSEILSHKMRIVHPFLVRPCRPGEDGDWIVDLGGEAIVGFDTKEVAEAAMATLTTVYNLGRAQGFVEGKTGMDPGTDVKQYFEAVVIPPEHMKN